MNPKLIIRLDCMNQKQIDEFMKKFFSAEELIIPHNVKILIKERDGFWRELETSEGIV